MGRARGSQRHAQQPRSRGDLSALLDGGARRSGERAGAFWSATRGTGECGGRLGRCPLCHWGRPVGCRGGGGTQAHPHGGTQARRPPRGPRPLAPRTALMAGEQRRGRIRTLRGPAPLCSPASQDAAGCGGAAGHARRGCRARRGRAPALCTQSQRDLSPRSSRGASSRWGSPGIASPRSPSSSAGARGPRGGAGGAGRARTPVLWDPSLQRAARSTLGREARAGAGCGRPRHPPSSPTLATQKKSWRTCAEQVRRRTMEGEGRSGDPLCPCAQVMETEAERLARLSGRDQAAIAAARAAEERKYYAQFTFKPAINEPSSGSAAAADRPRRTAAERSRNEEGARARMRAAALAEAEFRAQHPFRPQLATGGDTGGGNAFRLALRRTPRTSQSACGSTSCRRRPSGRRRGAWFECDWSSVVRIDPEGCPYPLPLPRPAGTRSCAPAPSTPRRTTARSRPPPPAPPATRRPRLQRQERAGPRRAWWWWRGLGATSSCGTSRRRRPRSACACTIDDGGRQGALI